MIAPRIACVVETGSRTRVAAKTHRVAPTRTARTKEESNGEWRILCGVNTENSRLEIRTAETLPRLLKTPPHRRGRRLVLPSGSKCMRDATLFPTSFAPFAKANTNRTLRPASSINKSSRRPPRIVRSRREVFPEQVRETFPKAEALSQAQ